MALWRHANKEDKNMTIMTKKFLTIMCTAMVADVLAFTACSNDDEPKAVSSEDTAKHQQVIVEQAKAERISKR